MPTFNNADGGADLVLSGITKRFANHMAVDNLDLRVPAGQFFALLGPSGCGKTTTLRMIAGLEHPTVGRITLGGDDVTTAKAHQRNVNTVFQSYALFPHLNVLDNVAFGLKRRKQSGAQGKAIDALKLVELESLAHRRPSQLSGGQQQRVALARALVNRPQVLLLDEPLGALDMKLRRQMQEELKVIQNDVGITFIHVTHDQEEALTLADTVAVMNDGRIEQMGRPEELYDLPRTTFVANFLGKSNLLQVDAKPTSGAWLSLSLGGYEVKMLAERAVQTSGEIVAGIRPEKIIPMMPGNQPAEADENWSCVRGGEVVRSSYTGVSTEYTVRVPDGQAFEIFTQNLQASLLEPGTSVDMWWDGRNVFGLEGDVDTAAGVKASA